MFTITLPHWIIPVVFTSAFFVVGYMIGKEKASDYDFLTPFISLACYAMGIVFSAGWALNAYFG